MECTEVMAERDPRIDVCRRNLRLAVALRETNSAEVSRRAGLSRNALSQFVNGNTSMSYANMLRVCDVLDLPIGVMHRPDAISEARLRLHTLLERLPDHLAGRVLAAVRDSAAPGADPT